MDSVLHQWARIVGLTACSAGCWLPLMSTVVWSLKGESFVLGCSGDELSAGYFR